MPLILDAYNILHVTGELPPHLAGIDVDGLVELIAASRYARHEVTVVCDGRRPAGADPEMGSIHVLYAGKGRSADDTIRHLIDASTAPRRLLVVSSDRAVLAAARRRRCETLTSAAFLAQLASDHERGSTRQRRAGRSTGQGAKPAGPLSPAQVEHWASIFGVKADSAAIEREIRRQMHAREQDAPTRDGHESSTKSKPRRRKNVLDHSRDDRGDGMGPVIHPDVLAEAQRLWNLRAE